MAAVSHFGCPKITLYHISYHFRSIPQFLFLCEFFLQNGCRRPFWMSENHFRVAFLAISDQYATFFIFFYKMAAVGHLDARNSLWITFLVTLDQYNFFFFFFFYKMAASGHFGCSKITFDLISGHFRTIRIWNFRQNGCRRPFWMSEIHFGSHFWPF